MFLNLVRRMWFICILIILCKNVIFLLCSFPFISDAAKRAETRRSSSLPAVVSASRSSQNTGNSDSNYTSLALSRPEDHAYQSLSPQGAVSTRQGDNYTSLALGGSHIHNYETLGQENHPGIPLTQVQGGRLESQPDPSENHYYNVTPGSAVRGSVSSNAKIQDDSQNSYIDRTHK